MKAYKISAALSVCYGVGTCVLDSIVLLKNYVLPKTLCEWGTGFPMGMKCFIIEIRKMLKKNTKKIID